jgi:hypothetical protein
MLKIISGIVFATVIALVPIANAEDQVGPKDSEPPSTLIAEGLKIKGALNDIGSDRSVVEIIIGDPVIPYNVDATKKASINNKSTKVSIARAENKVGVDEALKRGLERCNSEFGPEHWESLKKLVDHESGWRVGAINKSSGACGLFQAYPCSKMDGLGNLEKELDFGMGYIKNRYGNPTEAWYFWQAHRWY